MSLKAFLRRQKPFTVSLVSFLLMLAIVTIIGLAGGNHIVRYLQVQLMEHGLAHNEEVIEGVRPLLEQGVEDGMPTAQVISRFQRFIEHAEPFGVHLFLIDRASDLVIADSAARQKLPFPVTALLGRAPARRLDGTPIEDLGRWEGTAWRLTPTGTVELLTLRNFAVGGNQWTLGVSSNFSELLALMNQLHIHLDTVLLITYGLIGLLGFLVLRWVGRRYEAGLEEQVIQRTDELEAVHRALLEQERLATIGKTASVLAHEMRNPLASMKLALSGLRRSNQLEARERQRLDLVVGEVDRLENLLSETLEYVRPIEPDDQPASLDALLDQVMELEQPLLDSQGVRVTRTRCPRCPPLRVDSRKLRQVLLNLLRNAREATPRGGTMEIRLYPVQDGQQLEIRNPGGPLPPEVASRAFDLFFTTKAKGTGLGLGLVKRVVEEHGGRVALHSDKGEVAAVMWLPNRPNPKKGGDSMGMTAH